MTVTAQNGLFGFGVQSAKGTMASTWFRHRAVDINYGAMQDIRTFPLEVGGILTPTGAYKGGVFMAGGATLQPRLEGDLGWLLKAAMGDASTVGAGGTFDDDASKAGTYDLASGTKVNDFADSTPNFVQPLVITIVALTSDTDVVLTIEGIDDMGVAHTVSNGNAWTVTLNKDLADAATVSTDFRVKELLSVQVTSLATTSGTAKIGWYTTQGSLPYTHTFKFAADNSYQPWISAIKKIPGSTTLWEAGKDNKITSLRLNFPQNGIVSARVDLVGREPDWTSRTEPAFWGGNDFEEFGSVPVTCTTSGYVKVTGATSAPFNNEKLPLTGLSVTMANNLTSPQQEMVIGSPYPDDFAVLSRAMSFQATLKWADPSFYNHILRGYMSSGSWAADSGWSNTVFTSGIDALVESPAFVTGSTKYSMRVRSNNVMWSFQGGPVLAGGDIVMLQLVGTALAPVSGEYATIDIVNGQSSY